MTTIELDKLCIIVILFTFPLIACGAISSKSTPTPECKPIPTPLPAGTISVAGSKAVQPLAETLAEDFSAQYPDVHFDIQGSDSMLGIKLTGEGTVDVGIATRDITGVELNESPYYLRVHTIAWDVIVVIVHPDVEIDGLSKNQVRDIFAGEITRWNEVGGPDAPIVVVVPRQDADSREAFEEMVMEEGGHNIADTVILPSAGKTLQVFIAETPNSIGFVPFGDLDENVKAIAIDWREPIERNVVVRMYPLHRPFNMMIARGKTSDAAKAWLDFVLSEEGQAVVAEEGYIPINIRLPNPIRTWAIIIAGFIVWMILATIEVGYFHVRYDGKTKRGVRIWTESLPGDMEQFLRQLPSDIIDGQTRAFIKKQDNTVLVRASSRWRRRNPFIYVAYINLRVREPRIQYRIPISPLPFFILWMSLGVWGSFNDASALLLVAFGVLILCGNHIFERREILKFINEEMQTYCA